MSIPVTKEESQEKKEKEADALEMMINLSDNCCAKCGSLKKSKYL